MLVFQFHSESKIIFQKRTQILGLRRSVEGHFVNRKTLLFHRLFDWEVLYHKCRLEKINTHYFGNSSQAVTILTSISARTGVIQQVRGPNFTQFWTPTPLEWTKMDILNTIYPLSPDPSLTFTDPDPPSSCPRSYWMSPPVTLLSILSIHGRWEWSSSI